MNTFNVDAAIEPGAVLRNRRTVIANDVRRDHIYVLALTGNREGYDPWVTWEVNPETGDTFLGHYFNDFKDAVNDLYERGGGSGFSG